MPAPVTSSTPARSSRRTATPVARPSALQESSAAVRELDDRIAVLQLDLTDLLCRQDLGAETFCLRRRPARQLRSRDPLGKAQIVLDPGARPGLPAGGLLVDQKSLETFGGAVHCRRRGPPAPHPPPPCRRRASRHASDARPCRPEPSELGLKIGLLPGTRTNGRPLLPLAFPVCISTIHFASGSCSMSSHW